MAPNIVHLGLITGLDYSNPHFNPYKEFQKWKTHKSISKLLKGVSVVYHEAAQAGVRYSWDHFQSYMDNNIIATQRILEACKKEKQRIVFASSSSVYGDA